METREVIEEQFYVSIVNDRYNINENSVDHNADQHERVRSSIYKSLEQKKPLEMFLEDFSIIIIPYKILKTSDIRIVWNDTI